MVIPFSTHHITHYYGTLPTSRRRAGELQYTLETVLGALNIDGQMSAKWIPTSGSGSLATAVRIVL